MRLGKQIRCFIISGALGFLVDAGLLYFMMAIGIKYYSGRLASFLAAATFTWLFNRKFTFAQTQTLNSWVAIFSQWFRYMVAMLLGGGVNYGISAWFYHYFDLAQKWPITAVAIGSIAGLSVNFMSAKFAVFKAHKR
jgi:putative flippase GtrA